MKPYLFFRLGVLTCFLVAPAQAQNKDEISNKLASFNKPSDWVTPPDTNFKDAWVSKIQTDLSDPKFVKTHCASSYSDRHSEETHAEFSDIRRDVIVLSQICSDELNNGNLKQEILSDFQNKFKNESLYSYISKDGQGHPTVVYFTPVYACTDKGMGDAEKEKTRTKLKAGIGSEDRMKTKDSGFGCLVNQPSVASKKLKITLGLEKETVFMPGKYEDKKDYFAKLDTDVFKTETYEKVKQPLTKVLDDLEKRIHQKMGELELSLKERPLFETPSDKSSDDNFAYVIDRTGSYKGSFSKAIDELIGSINNYPKNKSFSVSFFGTTQGVTKIGNNDLYNNGQMIQATDANKKEIIAWLEKQKTFKAEGTIKNEYASEILNTIQSSNQGKSINYKYVGDGKISIDGDSEKTIKSAKERNSQFDFVNRLPASSSFTFAPMNDNYSKDFELGLGSKGKFVKPGENIVSAEQYYKDQPAMQKEYEKVKGDWETISTLKLGFNPDKPFPDDLKKWMGAQDAYIASSNPTNDLYQGMLGTKATYEKKLTGFNYSVTQLPDLIQRYGKAGKIDLPPIEYSTKLKTNYHVGTVDNRDGLIAEKACK